MRGVTSSVLTLARQTRASGKSMAPIPLEKLDELAEYLQRVDRLVIAAERFYDAAEPGDAGDGWSTREVAALLALHDALVEVQS